MTATTGTRITTPPGKVTRRVGSVYSPARFRCRSRLAAAIAPHRSCGSVQAPCPSSMGPHQIVAAIPTATRPTVASTGNSLLASHGVGRPSDTLDRLQAAVSDRLHEPPVVPLVLVRVALGEVGDRCVERVAAAEARGDRDGVPGPGVRPGQRPPAGPGVERERERCHRLDVGRALHVAELAPVVVPVILWVPGPAQVDIAGGLHHPLTNHHALAMLPEPALRQVPLQHRGRCLLHLQEERIVRVAPLKQNDERLVADAADADHLVGHVHDLEAIKRAALVLPQGCPVGPELLAERLVEVAGETPDMGARSRAGITIGGWLTIRYFPSTSSPSLDSACRLSRVCAFARAFSADLAALFASFSLPLACFLDAFDPFFASSASPVRVPRAAVATWSSSRWAYQMSIVRICAKEAIACR